MHAVSPRRLWALVETFHAVVYFAPEKVAAYEEAGLRGGWMGYFASRAAALGPVGAEVVAATFYNFHPRMVARALPDAWRLSTPLRVTQARHRAAGAALDRLVGDRAESVSAALEVLRDVVAGADPAGRPLFAAHAAQEWPDAPALALWQSCTLWREYRGDAHVAALVTAGLDGRAAHLTLAATGASTEDVLRTNRGWSEEEWEDARTDLVERGVLRPEGGLTEAGRELRDRVEAVTDARSFDVWARAPETDIARFEAAMGELVGRVLAGGGVPFPNPMGLPEALVTPGAR